MGLQEVANADAQFWLMQGAPNHRLIPCTVYYKFDTPLNESLVRARLNDLASSYAMFHRNVVELDGLPYWQTADVDWGENFRVLAPDEDIELVRKRAEIEVSKAAELRDGLPLFRAYLSSDRKQLVFVWHHVISDLEGMFNKHAKHLFQEGGERTQFGYQIDKGTSADNKEKFSVSQTSLLVILKDSERPIGFTEVSYEVSKIVLPIEDKSLYALGQQAALPMSDIFSFIALRTVTRYEESLLGSDRPTRPIRPMSSPISLRSSSLDMDEGNNRAQRQFPFLFPLESVPDMYQRIINLEPTAGSYDTNGKMMKLVRKLSIIEPFTRRLGMPDYISNYFPLADIPLAIGDSKLVAHRLRVPMVPYERTKFAWSNYNGEVQLYLHTDPLLIDKDRMLEAYHQAFKEVLHFLVEGGDLSHRPI